MHNEPAGLRRVDEAHGFRVRQREGDEVLGIADLEMQGAARQERRGERQREMKEQPPARKLQMIVVRRGEARVVVADGKEREEVVVLQRLDVLLGERLQLLRRIFAVAVGIQPLQRISGELLVEEPMMADRCDPTLVVEDDLGCGIDPDMGMSRRQCRRDEEENSDQQFAKAQAEVPHRFGRFSQKRNGIPAHPGDFMVPSGFRDFQRQRHKRAIRAARADEREAERAAVELRERHRDLRQAGEPRNAED